MMAMMGRSTLLVIVSLLLLLFRGVLVILSHAHAAGMAIVAVGIHTTEMSAFATRSKVITHGLLDESTCRAFSHN